MSHLPLIGDSSLTEPLLRSPSILPIEDPLSDGALASAPATNFNSRSSAQHNDEASNDDASVKVSSNARRIIMVSWLAFAGSSIWNQSVLAIFVYLLNEDHPECVGIIAGSMGLSQATASLLTSCTIMQSRRVTVLRVSSIVGISTITITAFGVWKEQYHSLLIALALWGFMWGISETTINSLFRDSIPPAKRNDYYRRASVVIRLANLIGPLVALVIFRYIGDEWTLYGCSVVMTVGLALCLPALLLLCCLRDGSVAINSSDRVESPDEILLSEHAGDDNDFQPEIYRVGSTSQDERFGLSDMDNLFASMDMTTPRLCCCKDQVAIPILIAIACSISEVASGLSARYFPVFFASNLQLTPTQVQVIYMIVPFGCSAMNKIGQVLSKRIGPCRVSAAFLWVSASLLIAMIGCYIQGFPEVAVCTLYVVHSSMHTATSALSNSVDTSSVPKESMTNWNTLKPVHMLMWSGSAAFGGLLAASYGILLNFYVAAGLQLIASLPFLVLWNHNVVATSDDESRGFLDMDEENDLSSIPHAHSDAMEGDIGSSRARLDTSDSSQYFDCSSFHSEISESGNQPIVGSLADNSTRGVCRYVNGRCVYEDGSPAYIHVGDDGEDVPPNYLAACRGDTKKARDMWIATQKWRQEKSVWMIHKVHNKWFSKIKVAYPHHVHGHSKAGYPVVYEQPGKMRLKELFREGCTIDDMTSWYTFFMEYLSNCICTEREIRRIRGLDPNSQRFNSSSWGFVVVMDSEGAGLSLLSGDVLIYLKRAGNINSTHFPLSSKRAFVVNVGGFLAKAWAGLSAGLPDSTNVDILSSKKYLSALREYIDDDQIPPEYGGSSPYRLGEHPYEAGLTNMIEELEKESRSNANGLERSHDNMTRAPPPFEDAHSNDAERNNFQRSTGIRAGQQFVQSLMPEKKTARRILSG